MNTTEQGFVKSFLSSKNYGFIKGDTGQSYFFHISNVKKSEQKSITDGIRVSFSPAATPKGYAAKQISLAEEESNLLYEVPLETIWSKKEKVSGWKKIGTSEIFITASSSDSPDDARHLLLERTRMVGAHGVYHCQYHKTTGSSGNYNYTVHNFIGIPCILGRKSNKGRFTEKELLQVTHAMNKVEHEEEPPRSPFWKRLPFHIAVLTICALIDLQLASFSGLLILLFELFKPAQQQEVWIHKRH